MDPIEDKILRLYGKKAQSWYNALHVTLFSQMKFWKVGRFEPYDMSRFTRNFVFSGLQYGNPVVVKFSPDFEGLEREKRALIVFYRHGAVDVLDDDGNGVLLLERAVPGTSLKEHFPFKDEHAVSIFCDVMKRLHKAPVPKSGFPHITDWLKALDKEWDIPTQYLDKARQLRDHLLKTSAKSVLLHGDLHHDNILLQGEDEWVVIDPKGVMGESAYEVGAFIRNPIPEIFAMKDVVGIIEKRIKNIAKLLKLEPQRILDWCFVQGVLAWVWELEDLCAEDEQDYLGYFRELVEIFDSMSYK